MPISGGGGDLAFGDTESLKGHFSIAIAIADCFMGGDYVSRNTGDLCMQVGAIQDEQTIT